MAEKVRTIEKESWDPKTTIGRMVKSGEITSLEQIFDIGKHVLESEIADVLIPNMEVQTINIKTTQRVTENGKRTQFRSIVVVGDYEGHVGIGVGKSEELKPSITAAVRNAKLNMISISSACGSWECKCQFKHSLPQKTIGKEGSTIVTLKPAPRGLGLAANDVVKKVLSMAGIKDIWSSSSGGRNVYNMAMATIAALDNLNKLK